MENKTVEINGQISEAAVESAEVKKEVKLPKPIVTKTADRNEVIKLTAINNTSYKKEYIVIATEKVRREKIVKLPVSLALPSDARSKEKSQKFDNVWDLFKYLQTTRYKPVVE